MSPRTDSSVRAMRGATFVELMFALAIVGITAMVQIQQVMVTLRDYHQDLDAEFATRKAAGILAEIQATVDQGNIIATEGLDALRDANPNPILTTRQASAPDDFMSGNLRDAEGQWLWSRKIEVEPVEGADRSRYVTVRMMRSNGAAPPTVLGVAAGIFSLTVRAEPWVQEFDVYVLAIAEAPSLWQPLPALRAQLQALADEVSGANPNIRFKLHWITKLGYGRDALYVPFVNQDVDAASAAPWVYWYPGKLAPGTGTSTLYAPEAIGGRVRTETGVLHDYSTSNPFPHAVADRNNHCMRTPEARDLFALRVAAGIDDIDEPPLQLLLADMAESPERFRNALFVNLHGEGLPFPPLRNHADPAKDPTGRPGLRVVTHPARLHTLATPNGPPVEFRVYAYETTPTTMGPGVVDTITVQILGGDFRNSLSVDRQTGGVDVFTGMVQPFSIDGGYGTSLAPKQSDPHAPFEMHYEIGYASTPQPHTWVRLHNTPKTCPADMWGRGLHRDAWLYGTDYVPSPVAWSDSFYALSNSSGSHMPKNTCRWRLRLDQATLAAHFGSSAMLTAVTRIGADTTTGQVWPTPNQPSNLSTTYAWWSCDKNDVPLTERYQFLGDPRHNPYLDLCAAGESFPHGYNWWFDDLRAGGINAAGPWTCFDPSRLTDGFGGQFSDDAPRMLQVWREALQACGGVFVNPHGQLAGRILLGGEVVLPEGPITSQPPAIDLHANIVGSATGTVAAEGPFRWFAGAAGRQFVRKNSFLAKPWLGELCGDADFAAYVTSGNAATSSGYAVAHSSLWQPSELPWGTVWDRDSTDELGELGCPTFAQGSSAASLWQTRETALDAELTSSAHEFVQKLGLGIPSLAPSLWRIVLEDCAPLSPVHPYSDLFPAQDLGELLSLATGGRGGSILRVADPCHGVALLVALCDRPLLSAQHRALGIKALGLGVRALIEGSATGLNDALEPLPLLQISEPTPQQVLVNPSSITIRWDVEPKWFEGLAHARAYAESQLRYVVTYQRLGETQWRHVSDQAVVTPENRCAQQYQLGDSGPGAEALVVTTASANVPTGEYFIRVECRRGNADAHVARHEVRVVVKR